MATDALTVFVLVFAVIGGTEFIDRTNFALIGLATKHPPGRLWAGAGSAFVITTAIAVGAGGVFLAAVGPHLFYLRLGGGLFLLGYATFLALVPAADRPVPGITSAFRAGFLTILLLELGDTTMILVVLFIGSFPGAYLVVGLAASLALLLVAASACLLGGRIARRVDPERLERYVIVVLFAVAVVTIVYALDPALVPPLLG
ncbi:MAG: TMEM165/GDT1 family protein [Thermoplasmata archaeon]|nr:TMEM165/GDT1 family protein [Thermoplasmata archaeon]